MLFLGPVFISDGCWFNGLFFRAMVYNRNVVWVGVAAAECLLLGSCPSSSQQQCRSPSQQDSCIFYYSCGRGEVFIHNQKLHKSQKILPANTDEENLSKRLFQVLLHKETTWNADTPSIILLAPSNSLTKKLLLETLGLKVFYHTSDVSW